MSVALLSDEVACMLDFETMSRKCFQKNVSRPSPEYALGYDLYGANNNYFELDKYRGLVLDYGWPGLE